MNGLYDNYELGRPNLESSPSYRRSRMTHGESYHMRFWNTRYSMTGLV